MTVRAASCGGETGSGDVAASDRPEWGNNDQLTVHTKAVWWGGGGWGGQVVGPSGCTLTRPLHAGAERCPLSLIVCLFDLVSEELLSGAKL